MMNMNMKSHILLALKEQFVRMDSLMESMEEAEITTARFEDYWFQR